MKSPLSFYSSLVALVLNSFLLPLIAFRSSPLMGGYKHLLFVYTLLAAFYSLVHFLTLPLFYASHSMTALYATAGFLPFTVELYLLLLFVLCWLHVVVIISLCFIYRYLSLVDTSYIRRFQSRQAIFAVLFTCFVFSIVMVINVYWACWPNVEKNSVMRESFFNYTGLQIDSVPYFGGPVYVNGKLQIPLAAACALFGLSALICGTVVVAMSWKIAPVFFRMMSSSMTKKLEYQLRLFVLLIVQTFLPIVFNFGPVAASHFCTLTGIQFESYVELFSSFFCIAQCVDPIVTFLLISEYHKTVLNFFSSSKKKESSGISASSDLNCAVTPEKEESNINSIICGHRNAK